MESLCGLSQHGGQPTGGRQVHVGRGDLEKEGRSIVESMLRNKVN